MHKELRNVTLVGNEGRRYLTRRLLSEGYYSQIYEIDDIRTHDRFVAKIAVENKELQQEIDHIKRIHRKNGDC